MTRPTPDQVQSAMAIACADGMRGQRDAVGYASDAAQMEAVWELSQAPPAPQAFEPPPAGPVAGVIAPHDDYLYAGRVYRRVLPLVTARTVIVVGVFHAYRRFGERDRLVFDAHRAWRAPDGPVPVSPLRAELLRALPDGDAIQDDACHDSEHSIEALVFWLRHARPDLEIVPVIVPACAFERLEALAAHLGDALRAACRERGWRLGRELAIAISTDGVHYGADFQRTNFGEGGPDAYRDAVAKDVGLMSGPLSGAVTRDRIRALYETFVDPDHPDSYRWTWCGRFSVPLGMLLLARVTDGAAIAHPLAYGTSAPAPELPLRALGLGATAPASLHHFVGHPAVAFTLAPAMGASDPGAR